MQSTISIPQLRAALNGRVITPDDARYDEARAVFYGGIDHHPAVIVRVADAADVSRVAELARETRLELAIRGGGHSNAGHGVSDGGIVLDLGDLRTLNIDVAGRTAWAETGLTAGEYTTAAGAHGLATGFAWGRFAVLRKAQSNCSQWVGHSFRATSGPAIRSISGRVEAMTARETTIPPRTRR